MKGYLTLGRIAERMGVARITIFRWIHKHGFPAAKLPSGKYYITDSMIDTWLYARNRAQFNGETTDNKQAGNQGQD